MRNCPNGFVVAEARNETTVDDLEDASFTLSCSIGSLIEKAAHVPVALRRTWHLFALLRTLRIRQAFGLSLSTVYSISPLPTFLDYRQTLSDFHEISRARTALQ
jgi:hypothetical protein